MKHFLRTHKTNAFFLCILFIILVFMFINTIQLPLLAGSVTCGQGACSCTCVGCFCDCSAGPGDQCYCMCSFPFDYNYCNTTKPGPDLPM